MYVNFGATARLAARGARARRLPAAGAAPTWLAGGVRPLTDHGLAARQHARAGAARLARLLCSHPRPLKDTKPITFF